MIIDLTDREAALVVRVLCAEAARLSTMATTVMGLDGGIAGDSATGVCRLRKEIVGVALASRTPRPPPAARRPDSRT